MANGKIMVVVGGQFGSEAKGHVAKRLLDRETAAGRPTTVVRVGGPNAGHTVRDASGVAWALRQVPVGAVVTEAQLVIAAGSEVDAKVLMSEITALEEGGHNLRGRLTVDADATLLEPKHLDHEKGIGLVEGIGSTGKGIGAARADRLLRRARLVYQDVELVDWLMVRGIRVGLHTGRTMTQQLQNYGSSIIIEGTQGYGLGLHAGYYPYCTSGDCRAIDFLAQAGLNPWNAAKTEVWVVVRPYPIRVAGNSGPMVLETTWEELGLEPEYTTVTKKMRRVGRWDAHLARAAVMANGGADNVHIAFTMADQVIPAIKGRTDVYDGFADEDFTELMNWVGEIESSGARVEMITTGPDTGMFR